VKFPVPKQDQEIVRHLGELLASGKFRPVVDRRYPLEKIVDAYEFVETGRKVGNVVITVVPPN
jgi:NADPH:quinone reductase-like Zn-dependent oxidoreductase